MEPLRIQSASGIHLPMQSESPYHPLKLMEPLQIQSASRIHLPMQSEYPYHPLRHMKPSRIRSAIMSFQKETWLSTSVTDSTSHHS